MVASEVSWKYLCKIKRVIWSQTQYERNVSWSQRRRYIGPKIIWVLTYWWEYCLCMNCFVTQHLKHITTNGAAARSSARLTSHRAGILKMVAPHNTEHSTQHSGYKTGGLHYSSCAHSAFLITISGHQQKVIIHEGRRIATALGAAQAMHLFKKMQSAWQFLNATQVYNTMQCIRQRNLDTGLV